MERMTKEELKELEKLKDFKLYVLEGDVYVKAEDFRKKAIECRELREENKNLKSDLEECECSMHFENDEVGYRKRECKKLNIKVASLEGEIKGLNYTIEKLKEENQTLESDGYKM